MAGADNRSVLGSLRRQLRAADELLTVVQRAAKAGEDVW